MSNGDNIEFREGMRERAFGENYRPMLIDRFDVSLSAHRIRKYAGSLAHRTLDAFGCGFQAIFLRTVLPELKRAVLVDSALADDLKKRPNVAAIEGILPDVRLQVPATSLDMVLCVSVLEHLGDPQTALQECYRIVHPGGVCMFSVPSWRGKWPLELHTFAVCTR